MKKFFFFFAINYDMFLVCLLFCFDLSSFKFSLVAPSKSLRWRGFQILELVHPCLFQLCEIVRLIGKYSWRFFCPIKSFCLLAFFVFFALSLKIYAQNTSFSSSSSNFFLLAFNISSVFCKFSMPWSKAFFIFWRFITETWQSN